MDPHAILRTLAAGRSLSAQEAEDTFEALLTGRMDEAQIGALLSLIQARGPTPDELSGAARSMRRHVTPVPTPPGLAEDAEEEPEAVIIDTCGTGGAPKTFNVSTAAAIVAAAAGRTLAPRPGYTRRVYVAKHGNRSRTGRGSAEVLQALGVNVDAPPQAQGRCLDRAGVCFCFAIHHHPAAKHAAGPRKSLGFPTIFNLLGPLTNPAGARRQLMGVYSPALGPLMARALLDLGARRAMVVHGSDGLDELTITGLTHAWTVEAGVGLSEGLIDPAALGLTLGRAEDIQAKDIAESAAMIRAIFAGERSPRRDMVVLNAAAALAVAGAARDLYSCLALAAAAIDSGEAQRTLDRLAAESHAP